MLETCQQRMITGIFHVQSAKVSFMWIIFHLCKAGVNTDDVNSQEGCNVKNNFAFIEENTKWQQT